LPCPPEEDDREVPRGNGDLPYADYFRVDAGRIVEHELVWDSDVRRVRAVPLVQGTLQRGGHVTDGWVDASH
jgi:hypothetical protein